MPLYAFDSNIIVNNNTHTIKEDNMNIVSYSRTCAAKALLLLY